MHHIHDVNFIFHPYETSAANKIFATDIECLRIHLVFSNDPTAWNKRMNINKRESNFRPREVRTSARYPALNQAE
jgi:hypothetical protein